MPKWLSMIGNCFSAGGFPSNHIPVWSVPNNENPCDQKSHTWAPLKVPKCENFHRTDFFYFFTIKPLWVGDFRAKIKN